MGKVKKHKERMYVTIMATNIFILIIMTGCNSNTTTIKAVLETTSPVTTNSSVEQAKIKEDEEAKTKTDQESKAKAEQEAKAKTEAEAKSKVDAEKNTVRGTLNMTPNEFKSKYNENAEKLKQPDLKFDEFELKAGSSQDIFSGKINDFMLISGAVNKKDGSIRDIVIYALSDGSFNSKIVLAVAAMNLTFGISKEAVQDITRKLATPDGEHLSKKQYSVLANGKLFSFIYSESMGYMYSLSDERDESNNIK